MAIPESADVHDLSIEKVLETTREMKRARWLDDPEDCDMSGMIQSWSDGIPVLYAFPRRSREEAAMALTLLGGIAKDLLVQISDSYHATEKHKTDGTPWEPGDMQYAWENNTPDKALLGEGLVCLIFDRKGNVSMAEQHYTATADALEFAEPNVNLEAKGQIMGYFVAVAHKVMTSPSMWDYLNTRGWGSDTFGLDEAEARTHAACAVAKLLLEQHIPCAIGCEGERAAEIVNESLAGYHIERIGD